MGPSYPQVEGRRRDDGPEMGDARWVNDSTPYELRLAKDGEVDRRNFARLGYERLTQGVYVRLPDTEGLDWREVRRIRFLAHARSVIAACGDAPVALAGPSALQALGVALPEAVEDWQRVHVVVPPRAYRSERADVIAYRRSDFWVGARRDGLPLQHPVVAWTQLRGATQDGLVEVGDGLIRRKKPLMTIERVQAQVARLAGRPGVPQVRRALAWVRPGTDSLYETRTRLTLLRAGLPEPTVNPPVHLRSVGRRYHIDMAYEAARLGVEYDGLDHVKDREQMEIDAERRRHLQDAGWLIITVTARQLDHPGPFLRSVEQALSLRTP